MSIPGTSKALLIAAVIAAVIVALLVAAGGPAAPDDRDRDPAAAADSAGNEAWPGPAQGAAARSKRPLLQLVGVTASRDSASAIILEKDGEARTYRVGDRVPGDRELIEIQASYVILRDAEQRLERLRISGRASGPQPDPEALREFAEGLSNPPAGTGDEPPE